MAWRFWQSRGARVTQQAAHWRVKMEDPSSQSQVDAFEKWLRADPAHLRAYRQVDTLAAAGHGLGRESVVAQMPISRRLWPVVGLAAVASAAFLCVSILVKPGRPVASIIANRGNAVRTVAVGDTSFVTLDTNSAIAVDAAARSSTVRLLDGRVRLVVHVASGKSLTVRAGRESLVASDCTVDLAMIDGGIGIRLIAGKATLQRVDGGGLALAVGQSVHVREGVVVNVGGQGEDMSWTLARVQFDNAPLGDILTAANRSGGLRLLATDPAIAALRVTAVLDLRDPRKLARKLAAALDLRVVERANALTLAR